MVDTEEEDKWIYSTDPTYNFWRTWADAISEEKNKGGSEFLGSFLGFLTRKEAQKDKMVRDKNKNENP